jgi:hypothetical protein
VKTAPSSSLAAPFHPASAPCDIDEREQVIRVDADAPTGLLVKSMPAPGRTDVIYYRTGSAGSRLARTDVEGAATRAELADLFDGGSSDPVRR